MLNFVFGASLMLNIILILILCVICFIILKFKNKKNEFMDLENFGMEENIDIRKADFNEKKDDEKSVSYSRF